MKILFKLISFVFHSLTRRIYWIYRLSKAQIGKGVRIAFPVRVEGRGQLIIGSSSQIGKNTFFGVGGKITLGKNCRIDSGVEIVAGPEAEIIFGDNCWVMSGTVIRARQGKFVFGSDVIISTNAQIFSREEDVEGNLSVGSGTHINDYAMLDVAGDLTLGNEVAFGQYSVVFTHDHDYSDKQKAAWKGGVLTSKVVIEDGAWIGAKVVILHGINIGRRTVIASGAVVTKDCEAEVICGGVPAKKIKDI